MSFKSGIGRLFVALVVCLAASAPTYAQQCGPMDVIFIVDETGSMGGVISDIQTEIQEIAAEIISASGSDFQLGLVGMPDNNIRVIVNPSPNNQSAFEAGAQQLSTAGGCGGVPYDEALNTVINGLKKRTGTQGAQLDDYVATWRPNASKVIILITDTFPQAFTCQYQQGLHDVAAHNFAEQARIADIHIAAVFVPTGNQPESEIVAIMEDVAQTSAGFYKEAKADASDISEIIVDIIKNCGGATGAQPGVATMVIEPRDFFLTNQQTATAYMVDYIQPPNEKPFRYSTEGLPLDSKITFTPTAVLDPTLIGASAQNLKIEIGPETPQGDYTVLVKAEHDDQAGTRYAVIQIYVDCRSPFLFGTADNQPQSTTVANGGTTTLRVGANGSGPFRYQWYEGATGSTAVPIAGATTANFTTPAITTARDFWVRISGPCGSTDSNTATVSPR